MVLVLETRIVYCWIQRTKYSGDILLRRCPWLNWAKNALDIHNLAFARGCYEYTHKQNMRELSSWYNTIQHVSKSGWTKKNHVTCKWIFSRKKLPEKIEFCPTHPSLSCVATSIFNGLVDPWRLFGLLNIYPFSWPQSMKWRLSKGRKYWI